MPNLADFTGRFSGFPSDTARHAFTVAALALLAVQSARIGWAVAAPLGPIGRPVELIAAPAAPADLAALDRFDPFFRKASMPVSDALVSGQMKLFGVRTGLHASAILSGPDGRQSAVAVGDEVSPGVVLKAVASDHVILAMNGRATKLAFPAPGSTPAAPYAPPPPPAAMTLPTANIAPQASGVSFMPDMNDPALLSEAGLQPGDTVISVDGVQNGQATVQYQRDGQIKSATLKLPQS